MRILMLSWEYPPRVVGGIARVVHDLAQKLGENGHEVHVVTCFEKNAKEFEKDKNVFVHRVHTLDISGSFIDWVHHLNYSMVEYCIRLFNDTEKFDVIHAHDWIVAFAARTLKYAYKVPLVSTIHATEYGRNNGLHNDMQRYISSVEWLLTYESWKVICNSNYMKSEINYVFQLPQDKIKIIANGVDTEKFKGIERDYNFRRNFAADNEKIVYWVGRMVQEKGASILMDAIPKILHYYHDAKFVFSGRGPQLDFLIAKAAKMGITEKVYFTGFLYDKDLLKLYKCSDVAVFPSTYEPFGIVALEGMVSGVPVVVSDVGGLGDIIEHESNGLKAYVGNAGSLADNILALLHDKKLADKCSKNALTSIKKKYTWDTIADQTAKLYKEVAKECSKTPWKIEDIKDVIKGSNELQTNDSENYYQSKYVSK